MVKKQARKIRKYFDPSSKPNQTMESGIHAIGGIGRNIWMYGMRIASATLYQPIRMPTSTPSTPPKKYGISMRRKLIKNQVSPVHLWDVVEDFLAAC